MQTPGHDPSERTATSTAVQLGGGNSSRAKASNTTHTQAPRDTRAHRNHPTTLRSFAHRMAAHPLMPSAMAFVSYGLVLDQVHVQGIYYSRKQKKERNRPLTSLSKQHHHQHHRKGVFEFSVFDCDLLEAHQGALCWLTQSTQYRYFGKLELKH